MPHLIRDVSSANRGKAVDARDVAAHQGKACIYQRNVQGMADEIIDQDRAAADAQRFLGKLFEFRGLEMMGEQAATDQIEAVVGEGKCERIGDDRAVSAEQVESRCDRGALRRA